MVIGEEVAGRCPLQDRPVLRRGGPKWSGVGPWVMGDGVWVGGEVLSAEYGVLRKCMRSGCIARAGGGFLPDGKMGVSADGTRG